MGLQLTNFSKMVGEERNENEIEGKEFNILIERKGLVEKLENSMEVDKLLSTIAVYEPETIISFGDNVASEISKCSDSVLNSMSISQITESSEMLQLLAKIIEKFDIEEIKEKPSGIFQKLFGNIKKQIEKILDKYHVMGEEVDKIYIQLRKYEEEIKDSNKKLDLMFNTNVTFYEELIKYIVAGEQGIKELIEFIGQKEKEFSETQDKTIQFDLDILYQSKELLEQRIHDLRIAENIAIQSIPMLKTMQYSNINLIRKINSAFIITLPIFKQALSQAILLKRQRLQAEAMEALDRKTNEMLLKNAKNSVEQSKLTAKLAMGSSIKIETLETTWKTIMEGINETRKIQEENALKRQEDKIKLEEIKKDFNKIYTKK